VAPTVAVFGVGPIGLGNVLYQSALGRRVLAVDFSAERLALARRLGAAEVVDLSEQGAGAGVERVRALTGGRGADVCIEASGSPQGALDCFAAARTAGTVVFNGEQGPLPLSPSAQFIRRDLTAVGSWFYHFGEIPAMVALYRGGLPVLDLVTHRVPSGQAEAAYALFAARVTGKVLLEWAV
jgi:propanol-preferring alcohol dehydrogenase